MSERPDLPSLSGSLGRQESPFSSEEGLYLLLLALTAQHLPHLLQSLHFLQVTHARQDLSPVQEAPRLTGAQRASVGASSRVMARVFMGLFAASHASEQY